MGDPLRLAHLAALRCGDVQFDPGLASTAVAAVNDTEPDLTLVAGDLTAAGYPWEYDEAVGYLQQLQAPAVVVPGSADSRNVGYIHFERLLGDRFSHHRIELEAERAEEVQASGVTVLALDSSEPDLSKGRVGREWYPWIRKGFGGTDDLKVLLLHHHLVAIPGAGRRTNVIEDAGDLLAVLSDCDLDMALSGAKHVPFFWGVNGMLVANCGTAGTHRLRGSIPPSWSEYEITAETIRVFMHYPDGTRELAAVRSRASQLELREAFAITDEFLSSNHLPVG